MEAILIQTMTRIVVVVVVMVVEAIRTLDKHLTVIISF